MIDEENSKEDNKENKLEFAIYKERLEQKLDSFKCYLEEQINIIGSAGMEQEN